MVTDKKTKTKSTKKQGNAVLPVTGHSNNLKNVILVSIGIVATTLLLFVALILKSDDQQITEIPVTDNSVINSNENQNELPQFFPGDFPIYDDAVLKNNWTTQSTNVTGVSVAWETNDSATKVYNYYFTELSSLGYKVEVLSQTDTAYTLAFSKDNSNGFIGITKVDTNTLISVTIGIKNE